MSRRRVRTQWMRRAAPIPWKKQPNVGHGVGSRVDHRYCACGSMKNTQGLCKRGCSK